eukprot:scaffold16092_cov103-Phaeocystis_antarctica.AAC.2
MNVDRGARRGAADVARGPAVAERPVAARAGLGLGHCGAPQPCAGGGGGTAGQECRPPPAAAAGGSGGGAGGGGIDWRGAGSGCSERAPCPAAR